MHSVKVILGGLVLWGVLLPGRSLLNLHIGNGALCIAFGAIWFVASGINMAMGMQHGGYSLREELPFFILVFSVPVVAAILMSR